MAVSSTVRNWTAALLGMGAAVAGGPTADAMPAEEGRQSARVPQQSGKTFGELLIWADDGRLYLSEDGGAAQELVIGDTAEARRLRDLLDRSGATAASPQVLQHRLILVGSGGDGFHWSPTIPNGNPGTAAARPSQRSVPAKATSAGPATPPALPGAAAATDGKAGASKN